MNSFLKRIQGVKEAFTEDKLTDEEKLVEKANRLLEKACEEHDRFVVECGEYNDLYDGTKNIEGSSQAAEQVVNIIFKNIEASIEPYVPQPRVDPYEEDDIEKKRMVEGPLMQLSQSPELLSLNNENERIAKKNSMAVYKVSIDPEFDYHTAKGRIKITSPHPVNIIPQPNIYKVEDMDYLFHVESRSIDYVCRVYGEEFREQLELINEKYQGLENFSETSYVSSDKSGMVSLVEYWYKDKEGDVCLLTFTDNITLRNQPKFFYKDTLEKQIVEDEDGQYETFYEIVTKDNYDEEGEFVGSEEIKVQPRIIKRFPFVIWYSTPKEKSFRGVSDVAVVKDQQVGLNKVLSNEQRKVINGTTKIFVKKGSGLKNKITNSVLEVIETDNPQADVIAKDMLTSDRSAREFIGLLDSFSQQVSGITNASQGLISTSLSGQAIQQLTMNAQSRLTPKKVQKNIAYTQLYALCYEFMLAFYDDRVPFRFDNDTTPTYGYFDKSNLVKQDESGEYYYPNFDVSVQVDDGLSKDRKAMLDLIMATGNHMEPSDFWSALERIGFPGATQIKERALEREQLAEQMQQLQEQQKEFNEMQNEMMNFANVMGGNQNDM